MNIDKLISNIIPPNDFQHRDGFTNKHIIDKLNDLERDLVEEFLINELLDNNDMLIVETLSYLKSERSLPILYLLLNNTTDECEKIIIASSIYSVKKDIKVFNIAIDSFRKLESIKDTYYVYRLLPMFYYLKQFQNEISDSILQKYTKDSNYLISYNAKKALNG